MELRAPSHWRTLEFIADVHLFEQDQHTFEAWRAYLRTTKADALFILGDLFEVWVGDDVLDCPTAFERTCADALRECARWRPVFFLPGNRDFLVGDAALRFMGLQRLPDPCTLVLHGTRIALSHGDILCTDDQPYQQFRTQVRSPQWQRDFLQKPLGERKRIARSIRQASEDRKQASVAYVDVNTNAVHALLRNQRATVLIHGHTHEGATHNLDGERQRVVLSDWHAGTSPVRLETVRLLESETGSLTIDRVPLRSNGHPATDGPAQ